jgi:hypothetical protein
MPTKRAGYIVTRGAKLQLSRFSTIAAISLWFVKLALLYTLTTLATSAVNSGNHEKRLLQDMLSAS